jgi:hypothetical protein
VNLAKLASSADDSAGGITDTRGYVKVVLEKTCSGVEYGSAEAEFIFLQSIKDSRNEAFNGWDEFVYDLLEPTARLATAKNVGKLYAVLDEFTAKLSQKEYTSWYPECDCFVRLAAVTAVDGEQAAENFIDDNLRYDGIRHIAIRKAISKADYARAEELCLEKINEKDRDYHWTREWYDRLFEVYLKTDDKEKQADLAEDLLVHKRDTTYYAVFKGLLIEKGEWKAKYPSLLERLGQSLPYFSYQDILSKEGETLRLLDVVRIHPSSVFEYGKQLSAKFPRETYTLCLDEIRKQAAEADKRTKYREVCDIIKKLFEFGGITEAEDIITELKKKYPHRSALLDELNFLAMILAKKKK